MDVLVAGGTGFIGRHLCGTLHQRGHDVTAMSRDPDTAMVPDDVATQAADITTFDGLSEVVAGRDAVVNLVSLTPLFQPRGGEQRHEAVTVEGTRNLVRAMDREGVDRILFQSGLGADTNGPTHYLRAKGRAEGILHASDLDWRISRPSIVFGDGAEFLTFLHQVTTPYVTALPGGGHTRFQPIWVHDLVAILARMLEDDERSEQTYELGGPEERTLADLTRAVYRENGRSVRIVPIPMPVTRVAFRVGGVLPLIPFGPDQYRGLQFVNVPEHNDVEQFDIDPGTLGSFDEYLAGDLHASEIDPKS